MNLRSAPLLFLAIVLFLSSGCATHRYPAYRGRVLELGTDKPIEGAGVLAVYYRTVIAIIERNSEYHGYQAVLTDKEGKFEIPAKRYVAFRPLPTWFDPTPYITIYKAGYGNFPGSIGGEYVVKRPKQGKTIPDLERGDWFPPEKEVVIWLPKLETEEEISEHDRIFSGSTTNVLDEKGFPPPGTRKGQFLPRKYTGERR